MIYLSTRNSLLLQCYKDFWEVTLRPKWPPDHEEATPSGSGIGKRHLKRNEICTLSSYLRRHLQWLWIRNAVCVGNVTAKMCVSFCKLQDWQRIVCRWHVPVRYNDPGGGVSFTHRALRHLNIWFVQSITLKQIWHCDKSVFSSFLDAFA